MRIALASQAELPDWEVDEAHLHEALRAQGVDYCVVSWDAGLEAFDEYDACLVRTTWDYAGRREEFLAWAHALAERMPVHNPPAVLSWSTDKRYLRELGQAGLPVIPSVWLEPGADPDPAPHLAELGCERGFLKPWVGASSREALRFDADEEGLSRARAHLERTLASEGMLLQPYLEGVEREGELSHVFFDGELAHSLRRTPRPGDFRVQECFGATDALEEATQESLELGRAALAAAAERCGLRAPLLYGRVDFLRGAQGELLINELELVEPHFFFRLSPESAGLLVERLQARLAEAVG